MYAVFDKNRNSLDFDQYGHVKLYKTEKAARRRAQGQNNSTFPRLDRWAVIAVRPVLDVQQGRPNFTDV